MVTLSTTFKPRAGICIWALLSITLCHGQLSIQQVDVQGENMSPSTFFHAMVLNGGGAQAVRFEGRLVSKAGEQVLSFSAQPMVLQTGALSLRAEMLTFSSFAVGPGPVGRTVRQTNRLPEGDYTFCLRARSDQGEDEDELCEVYRMEELIFLDLISPWNGDTIDEVRPTLSWVLSGSPTMVQGGQARIVVVPLPKSMSTAQALASQVPVYMHPETSQRTLAHPPGQPDLLRGQCYAWQAERVLEGRVVDRSDPWSFCVRKREEPTADKYIRLDRMQPGIVYKAIDRRLFFRYDEPYASQSLTCAVIDAEGRRLEPEVNKEGAGTLQAGNSAPGANLYELDLSPYGLKPGIYTLEVRDIKGRRYELRFESKY
jgi:hypothetical protein